MPRAERFSPQQQTDNQGGRGETPLRKSQKWAAGTCEPQGEAASQPRRDAEPSRAVVGEVEQLLG